MEIEAKPTQYAGVLFRSKLEATWARFFDMIEVDWEYEPTAIPGWIPDFLIAGWWLAEVKPVPVTGAWAAREPVFAKAVREFDTVLLGDGPGDALGLVVRKIDGGMFVRSLMVDLTGKATTLRPVQDARSVASSSLTAIWQGVNASHDPWRSVGTPHLAAKLGEA